MKLAQIAPATIPANTANSIQGMKMAQGFLRAGHVVRLYAPGERPRLDWAQIAEHYGLSEQIDIQWLPSDPMLRGYDYAWRAVKEAEAWGAQALYTRLPQAAALAARRGLPTIHELHDLPTGRMGPRLLRAFLRGRGARRLVLISQALADALAVRYPLPDGDFICVAHDAVDLTAYASLPGSQAARKALGLPEGFTVGYTGHLYAGRGADLILEMARQLPEVNFLLAGGRDEDVSRVRALAAGMGLQNVILTGFVPNAQMPRYQAACELLLMPYQAQVAGSSGGDIAAFLSPMKMFEYLASSRAILASDLRVLGEVLSSENAVILPGDDVGAWVGAIRALQEDDQKREALSRSARKTAEQHSWERRAEAILDGLQG